MGPDERPGGQAVRTALPLGRSATALSVGVAAAVTATSVAAPGLVREAAPALLALGVATGLPHGAADHVTAAWARGGTGARPPVDVLLGYLGAAGVTLGAVLLAPTPTLLALLGVSVVHFGLGEVTFAAERDGHAWRPALSDVAPVIALGGLPVVVPLVRWPADADPVLAALSPALPALLTREVRAALAAAVGTCAVVTVLRALRARRRLVAAEAVLLAALPVAAPPLASFGVYFGAWHSVRHTVRLLSLDARDEADLAAGRVGPPLRRYARAAAAPTAVAALGIAGLAAAGTRPGFAAPALAVLLGLTVPHVGVVALLDRRRSSRPVSR